MRFNSGRLVAFGFGKFMDFVEDDGLTDSSEAYSNETLCVSPELSAGEGNGSRGNEIIAAGQ